MKSYRRIIITTLRNGEWRASCGILFGTGPTEADAVYALYVIFDEDSLEKEEAKNA